MRDVAASQLQYYWQRNTHWHQAVHHRYGLIHDAHCAYLERLDALRILSAFEGIPCVEEVVVCLNELYDVWYASLGRRKQSHAAFIDFVCWRAEFPVECWLYGMGRQQPENEYWHIALDATYQRDDTLIQAAYANESYLPSTWERHCALIDEWREKGKTAQEIFQQLPLDLPEWPEQAQIIFRKYHLKNLYQALKFIYTELTQNDLRTAKQIVSAYLAYLKQ